MGSASPIHSLCGNYLNGYYISFGAFYNDFTVSNAQAFGTADAIVSTEDDLAAFERALLSGKPLPPQQAELKTMVPVDGLRTGVESQRPRAGIFYPVADQRRRQQTGPGGGQCEPSSRGRDHRANHAGERGAQGLLRVLSRGGQPVLLATKDILPDLTGLPE
ncbi:predicted protein [Streptomyces sp. AA4]|nr:predicted protein [Streptomyces sp. AA4]